MSDMAIYFIESKYREIFKLKQMLEKEKIPFDFTCTSYPESNFIHYHLEYPNKSIWTEAVLFQLLRVSVLME